MKKTAILVLASLLTLAGCASTFETKLATGYQSVTAIRTTATTLTNASQIKANDAQNVLEITDKGRTALDIARDVHATDPDLADDKLESALTILESIKKYLGDLLQ